MRPVLAFALSLTLVACTPPPKPPDLTKYPSTTGNAVRVPEGQQRVLVWGGHPAAHSMAIAWLQGLDLEIADASTIVIDTGPSADLESDVLLAVREQGIHYILFVETPLSEGAYSWSRGQGTAIGSLGGTSTSTSAGTTFSASVAVRCVDAINGEVIAVGSAFYPEPSRTSLSAVDDVLTKLTCQALATAWGFRRPGALPVSSQEMCDWTRRASVRSRSR